MRTGSCGHVPTLVAPRASSLLRHRDDLPTRGTTPGHVENAEIVRARRAIEIGNTRGCLAGCVRPPAPGHHPDAGGVPDWYDRLLNSP